MDIRELKKLLKNSTSVLILDDGEPAFVVLDYGVYKKAMLDKESEKTVRINHSGPSAQAGNGIAEPGQPREADILERLNKEILALKDQIETEERRQFAPEGE